MKKARSAIAVCLAVVMCFALAGCGGEKKAEEKAPEPEKKVLKDITGMWECTGIVVSDGETELTEEYFEESMGLKAEEMLKICVYSDGTGVVTADEQAALLPAGEFEWKETEKNKNELTIAGAPETVTAVQDDRTMVISMGEETDELKLTLEYTGRPVSEIEGWDLEFSEEDSRAMSNFMHSSRFLIDDGILYGSYGAEEAGKTDLISAPLDKDGNVDLKKKEVIGKKMNCTYLSEKGNKVYAIAGKEKIISFEKGSKGTETVYEGKCDYLQITGDNLYFTDETGRFCRTDLEGADKTTVLDKPELYYAYMPDKDWLIYQDDPDSETVHFYNIKEDRDCRVTEEASYCPVIYGDYMYYFTNGENDGYWFNRMDLIKKENEKDTSINYQGSCYVQNDKIIFFHGGMPFVGTDEWNTLAEVKFRGVGTEPMYSNGVYSISCEMGGEAFIAPVTFDKGSEDRKDLGYIY